MLFETSIFRLFFICGFLLPKLLEHLYVEITLFNLSKVDPPVRKVMFYRKLMGFFFFWQLGALAVALLRALKLTTRYVILVTFATR